MKKIETLSMRRKKSLALFLLLALTLTFSVRSAYGHTWNQEHNGEAAVTACVGLTQSVAEYDPGRLRLGGKAFAVGDLVAEGAMHVYGYATASGWVTGAINWWQVGSLAGIGVGVEPFEGKATIQVKFKALDVNENSLVENVTLEKSNPWYDDGLLPYTGIMRIYLTKDHLFRFSLYAKVEADAIAGIALADYGWGDGRIEWGYIDVPNTAPVDIWPDVCNLDGELPGDGNVTAMDFAVVYYPQNIFARREEMKPWPDPPGNVWGTACDVNFDRKIGVGDLMNIGVNYGDPWPPSDPGGAQSNVHYEGFLANSSNPQVSVYPAIVVVAPGKTFTVNITVSNVTDLYGWEFWMSFNPTILTAVNVTEGSFLKAAGDTFWATPKINNAAGTIAAGAMLWPIPSQGATGNGTLATVTFQVQSDGKTLLQFDDTELDTVVGSDTIPMTHDTTSGYLATTIQAAINWANATATIHVAPGTYYEHVTLNKSLTLIGENIATTIIDGGQTGDVALILANNTNISGFTITNGFVGIHLYNASNTNIVGNKISNNNVGIKLSNSNTNIIHHNNFINNSIQVESTKSVNSWDNGSEGNYWSDYTGKDRDGDGIGDTPYVINGRNKDNYPLMKPWNPP